MQCKTSELSIYDRLNYTEEELHILTIIEIIKRDRPDCKGDCRINVYAIVEYFDDCLVELLSKNQLEMYDPNKKNILTL